MLVPCIWDSATFPMLHKNEPYDMHVRIISKLLELQKCSIMCFKMSDKKMHRRQNSQSLLQIQMFCI